MISLRDCMKCVTDTECRAMRYGGRIVPTKPRLPLYSPVTIPGVRVEDFRAPVTNIDIGIDHDDHLWPLTTRAYRAAMRVASPDSP
jgi:hypothetical protein